ncbi:hypothetical protein DFJ74DRAFT_665557 [Hyaloraphidium curvatum]|nr:hypothetical protein DFJ74DRAFT_665557 [Hyaloraphidium curvatum]
MFVDTGRTRSTRVNAPRPQMPPDPESILGSSLNVLFGEPPISYSAEDDENGELAVRVRTLSPPAPDDTRIRLSEREFRLRLPAQAAPETALMAHYLWNASIVLARMAAFATSVGVAARHGTSFAVETNELEHWEAFDLLSDTSPASCLELGAASGLLGLACSNLLPSSAVVLSDYPAPEILDALSHNISRNGSRCFVCGHAWGSPDPMVSHPDGLPVPEKHDLLLLADTLYHPPSFPALIASLRRFSNPGTRALLAFGLHTGPWAPRAFLHLAEEDGWEVRRLAVVRVTGDLLDDSEQPVECPDLEETVEAAMPHMRIAFSGGRGMDGEDWDGLVPAHLPEEEKVVLKKGIVVIYGMRRG